MLERNEKGKGNRIMENSNVINIQNYRINRNYYTIGLIVGALRAELENGTVELSTVYGILTDRAKAAISGDLAYAGGADR